MAHARLFAFRPLVLATLLVTSILRSIDRPPTGAFVEKDKEDRNAAPPPRRRRRRPAGSEMVVDILSVGSVNRLDLLDVQRRTMGSHVTVRNFFSVTELDEADDPECHRELTWEQVRKVCRFCRKKAPANSAYAYMTGVLFASEGWLKKKANPVGWMCAQRRPLYGLAKAAGHYKRHPEGDDEDGLPDWLVVVDDDTYYNMELFHGIFRHRNASDLDVSVGCLMRAKPAHGVSFTFPYGGFGTAISRASLERLLRPVECPSARDRAICDRIGENNVGELRHFRSGMSLIDLFRAYAGAERYRDVDRWSDGYCVNSDWLLGYVVNYYNVSRHVGDPAYALVPQARLEPFVEGSEVVPFANVYRPRGLCKNDHVLRERKEACHYAPASWMEEETDRWRQLVPHRFRNVT